MFENLKDAELWFTQLNFNQDSIGLRWVLLTGSCSSEAGFNCPDSKVKMCLSAVGFAKAWGGLFLSLFKEMLLVVMPQCSSDLVIIFL